MSDRMQNRTIFRETGVFAEKRDWGRYVAISLLGWTDTERWIGAPVEMRSIGTSDECYTGPPTLELSPRDAQRLFDELWNLGFRPADGSGSNGQLAATEHHLDDMRTIVGSLLEVPLDATDRKTVFEYRVAGK